MVRIRFRRWEFDANPLETKRIYALLAQRKGDRAGRPCPCHWCRNFYVAREQGEIFPQEILSLFDELGIDYRGEVELLSPGPRSTGLYGYSAWFPFVANGLEGPDAMKPGAPGSHTMEMGYYEAIGDHLRIGFTDFVTFSADLFDDMPTLEAVVSADVRWLLSEAEPNK